MTRHAEIELSIPNWLRRALGPGLIVARALARSEGVTLVFELPDRTDARVLLTRDSARREHAAFSLPSFAIVLDASPTSLGTQRGKMLCRMVGSQLRAANRSVTRWLDAVTHALEASETSASHEEPPGARGIALIASGALEAALDAFETLPEADAAIESQYFRGLCLGILGRRAEALAICDRLARHAASDQLLGAALARFLRLHEKPRAALELLTRNPSSDPRDAPLVARVALDAGDASVARSALERVLEHAEAPEELSLASGALLVELGDFEAAQTAFLRCTGPRAALWLAELACWRADASDAEHWLARVPADPPDPRALRTRGVLAVLGECYDEAVLLLERALALDAADHESRIWLAEAELGRGQPDRALTELNRVPAVDLPAARLLKLSAIARRDGAAAAIENETVFELDEILASWAPASERAAARGSAEKLVQLVRSLLVSFAGNRSARMTRLVAGRLEPVPIPETSRRAALTEQRQLLHRPPAAVLEALSSLCDRFPDSPHPRDYRAEVLLWLGDYAGALADLEQLRAKLPWRWVFMGGGAALAMLGRHDEAEEWWHAGQSRFGVQDAEATFAYRGESRLRQGDRAAALDDLERAVRARPTRIGTRLCLALAKLEAGQHAEAEREIAELRSRAPGLWRIAERANGEKSERATIVRALAMMRGNRSSALATFFAPDGTFSVLTPPTEWRRLAESSLPLARRARVSALLRRAEVEQPA